MGVNSSTTFLVYLCFNVENLITVHSKINKNKYSLLCALHITVESNILLVGFCDLGVPKRFGT